jgi:hypothetical protein
LTRLADDGELVDRGLEQHAQDNDSASKWRPLNSSSTFFSLPIADLTPFTMPA